VKARPARVRREPRAGAVPPRRFLLLLPLLALPAAGAATGRLAGALPAAVPARYAAAAPPATAAPRGAVPAVAVTVALPAVAVTVGDRVEAVVTVRVPAAALAGEPRFPMWRGAWGEAEVREQGVPRRAADAGGLAVFSQRLVLAAFRPGKVELPPAAIAVPLSAGTVQAWTPAGAALTVRSVLPAGADAKKLRPRPPAPLRPLPLGTPFFIALAVLAAAAAAAVWALWRRERRRRAGAGGEAAATPLLAPLPELLAALDRLDAEPSAVALHTGLSQALRRYLGRTAAFPAPESTTTEIQRRLLARGWPSSQARPAVELLRGCDLVKFARQEVPAARGRERLLAARRLAEQIEERVAATAAAAAATAAAGGARGGLEAAG